MAKRIAHGNWNSAPEWPFCCWPHCRRRAEGGGPPLCISHFKHVGKLWFEQAMRERAMLNASEGPTAEEHARKRDAAMSAQSQVYYIRIGDHVKIGYTINMRQRITTLRVDDDALLATEPGGRALEAQRHQEFLAERVGRRENFNPSPRLLAHIEQVRAEHGTPTITRYVRA